MTLTTERVTIHRMARSWQRLTDSPLGDELDEASRAFKDAEQAFETARVRVLSLMARAKREGMPVSEIARRTGYSREHASKLLSDVEAPAADESDP